jgi:hypothetical protein
MIIRRKQKFMVKETIGIMNEKNIGKHDLNKLRSEKNA